ncbi:MAG: nucleotidyltransferase substrate binding protein [Carboxydocellales bacterium]
MTLEKLKQKYENYSKAVQRLEDSLKRDETDEIVLDAVIQRFEFSYELSWKIIKTYLSYHGIAEVRSPREAFKEAFASEIIKEGELWIDMLEDRNLTSHIYNEVEARKIFEKIKTKYFFILKELQTNLTKEINI